MAEPIAFTTVRYRCPSCRRTHSTKSRARRHMDRCWYNPDAAGCFTCRHFVAREGDYCDAPNGCGACGSTEEHCALDVSLKGRPECGTCSGEGSVWRGGEWPDGHSETCPGCKGRPDAVKPGPIVHCPLWELSPDFESAS